MIVLELSDDEARRLREGLERFLMEMDREIVRTDSREYREDLKRSESVIREVADELRRAAA